jgi:hypothetical protein
MSSPERWVGIVAVDPGVTTGMAWGIYNINADSVGASLREGEMVGWGELTGSEQWQAGQVVGLWEELTGVCVERGIGCDLVLEDFILRPGRATADRAQLAPVRIISLIEGMILARGIGIDCPLGREGWETMGGEVLRPVVKQTPAAAKTFATSDRLKAWGVWKTSMRHSRDAWRHTALRIATLVRNGG